ncbi:GNAT family N-acetyltransferase [Solicola sp. PLA-1-18]|uniref:GNAT family N-acetyltransferase n=1 Tax=Solicola sp. PLA-1-18 TaxID=3380532 RepID=UPI003B786CC1
MWRVRTTLGDHPGALADLAARCGAADLNILGLQVFPGDAGVTDELVLSGPDGTADDDVARAVAGDDPSSTSVTRCDARSLRDAPTRWLEAARRVSGGEPDLARVLEDLLETDPPDLAEYAGHDQITVAGPAGDVVVRRAVAFTPAEQARAAALAALVTRPASAAADEVPAPPAEAATVDPALVTLRASTAADAAALVALHARCGDETLLRRYHAPMNRVITTRLARRLAAPDEGVGLVVEVGDRVVAHGLLVARDQGAYDRWELSVLVEDGWQRRGLGVALLKQAARHARAEGARELAFVTQAGNDAFLRTVGRAGFTARIRRRDGVVEIVTSLREVRPRLASAEPTTLSPTV